MKNMIHLFLILLALSFNVSAQAIRLDYDAVDEARTVSAGGTYNRFIWPLNSHFDPNDTNLFALTWGAVRFDTLYDAGTMTGYPRSGASVHLDSVTIGYTHENVTGTTDTIRIVVYAWAGSAGIQTDTQLQITNPVLWDTLYRANTSATGGASQLGQLKVYPDVALPSPNNRFVVAAYFYGNTANTFTLQAGYGNRCSGNCMAYPSVFVMNSIYRIIAWSGTTDLGGINSLAYDCNGNGTQGEPGACEGFAIQNLGIAAYVSMLTCNASFSYTNAANTYSFQNASTGINRSYSWSFGDGNFSAASNPSHTFDNGTYQVCLRVFSNSVLCDSVCQTIIADSNACAASFGYSVNGSNVNFGNTSAGNNLTFSWSFGDNTFSSLRNPVHTYAASGSYTVCLAINDSSLCYDTVCTSVNVTVPTSCNAAFTSTTSQNTVTFSNLSTGPGISSLWDFGDGTSTSGAINPVHTYGATGVYTVCLRISNVSGCVDSFCSSVTITTISPCNAAFTYTNSGNTYDFQNASTGSGGFFYIWNFGDGATSTQQNPTHTYANSGTYNVVLAIADSSGCTHSITQVINVPANPSCAAGYTYSNAFDEYYFNNTSAAGLNYLWNFGDGATSSLRHPAHLYTTYGDYNVCLVVSDSAAACIDTFCSTISPCDASFTFSNTGTSYAFQNNSPNANLVYSWNFGDSSFSTQQNPPHNYAAPGVYTVCLALGNSTGCSDTSCLSVVVVDSSSSSCDASFSYTVSGRNVTFNNTSSNYTSSFWSFGDSTNSTSQNPSHTYNQNGTYQVCLTIIDTSGCTDNICQNVLISGSTQQHYCISGRVSKGIQTNAAFPATVYLIYNDTALGTLTSIRTATTDTNGNYQFCTVPTGKYIVKAALNQGAAGYTGYIPTYFGNSLFWNYASEILLTHNFQQIDIWLIAGNNPGGPGFVGGNVSQGANKMAGPGDPLANIQIMLLDEFDNPVQYIYSDSSGNWDFSGVAYGTYKVYAEVLGIPTFPYTVIIGPENETAENIQIIIESTQVISSAGSLHVNIRSVKIYPNPTNELLNVNLVLVKPAELKVSITDITGKTVIEQTTDAHAGNLTLRFDLTQQQPGVYFVRLAGKDDFKTFKVIKY